MKDLYSQLMDLLAAQRLLEQASPTEKPELLLVQATQPELQLN